MKRTAGGLGAALGLLAAVACSGGARPGSGGGGGGGGDSAPPSGPPPAPASAGDTGTTIGSTASFRDPVPLTASVVARGATATYKGLGECHHTTDASIYDVPATMWTAAVDARAAELSYLNLTLWQPKSGGDLQISLGVTIGRATYQIATVKGAPIRGSGSATVESRGAGGSLVVRGADPSGGSVLVTVDCSAFTEPVAEGG
jgi:hypothetical protein